MAGDSTTSSKLFRSLQGHCKILQCCNICEAKTVLVELNILHDFSLHPAITFSFGVGSMRYFIFLLLHSSGI